MSLERSWLETRTIEVTEPSQAAAARQEGLLLADCLGFDEAAQGRVALTITEAATNLYRHAGGGEIVLSVSRKEGARQIDVLSLDQGPGIRDLGRILAGGVSTGGTLGHGVGAIRRLADDFDIFTSDEGTGILARFSTIPPVPGSLPVGAICVPKQGQEVCGDGWGVQHLAGGLGLLLLVDGLGHGPGAAEAARRAVDVLTTANFRDSVALMEAVHEQLHDTRGAVVAVACLDPSAAEVSFVGVGNIQATILTEDKSCGMVSHNGTVGFGQIRIQEFRYAWPPGSLAVFNTDGLSSRWQLRRYPGLVARHPALIAAILYRDYRRHDDSAALMVRHPLVGMNMS